MPPVIIAAGIGAAGSLVAAKMSSDSAKKATQASSAANANALAFEREKLAKSQANYDAYNQMRTALLHRYGVDIAPSAPGPGAAAPGGAMPQAGAPAAPPAAAVRRPVMGAQQPMTIGDMVQQGAPTGPNDAPPPDLGSWNDWRRQGIA